MSTRVSWGAIVWLVFGGLFVAGCESSALPTRLPVSGNVTLDGAPLDQGTIQFEPQSKSGTGPQANAAATIKEGKFEIPAQGGLLPGSYLVSISSRPQAGATSSDPIKAMEEASKPSAPDRIPAKYNAKSELRAEVKKEGPNTFEFKLESK